jgi:hypothetical protein
MFTYITVYEDLAFSQVENSHLVLCQFLKNLIRQTKPGELPHYIISPKSESFYGADRVGCSSIPYYN